MKKIFFFLTIFTISIFLLKQNNIINKSIVSTNTNIDYPYFDNMNINNHILNYVNSIEVDNNNILYLDYDYNDTNKTLTFYKTIISNNIVNEKVNTFKINKNTINRIDNIRKVNTNDIYNYLTNNTKLIAFTFDDGPNYNTVKVIDTLKKYNATATFFVMGKNIKGNEEVIKYMQESNMEIGNHTYNHLLLTKYSKEKIQEEITKTSNLIFDITGSYPTLLRPSYGSVNKKIKEVANMPIIIWNIDTLDWKYKNSQKIATKVLNNVKDGDIILMHDIYKSTLNSLDIIIPELISKGFRIVSVSELAYYKNLNLEKSKVYGFIR